MCVVPFVLRSPVAIDTAQQGSLDVETMPSGRESRDDDDFEKPPPPRKLIRVVQNVGLLRYPERDITKAGGGQSVSALSTSPPIKGRGGGNKALSLPISSNGNLVVVGKERAVERAVQGRADRRSLRRKASEGERGCGQK